MIFSNSWVQENIALAKLGLVVIGLLTTVLVMKFDKKSKGGIDL